MLEETTTCKHDIDNAIIEVSSKYKGMCVGTNIDGLIKSIRNNIKDVRFNDLVKVCDHYFGSPRQNGSSHCIYKTPWQGDPRINIQNSGGKAKPYQVKQVLLAIDRLEGESHA